MLASYPHVEVVDRIETPQLHERFASGIPFVFSVDWPAIGKWDPSFICKRVGNEIVSVSESIDEQSTPTHRRQIKFCDYVNYIEGACGTVSDQSRPPLYLKQFDLFKACPKLRTDVDLSVLPHGRKDAALWLGPRNSVTGMHCDPNNGILVQVYGSKRIILFAPEQRTLLYPNEKYDPATECCEVDALSPDLDRFPLFASADGQFAELSRGQALFIPRGWYHQVLGLENNISVNCFFFTYLEFLTKDLFRYRVPRLLHELGVYKRGNCVCHGANRE